MRAHMVRAAYHLIGAPSIAYTAVDKGMDVEHGFDCSGFVSAVICHAAGAMDSTLQIPRHANEQWRSFGEYADYEQRQAGDLVYFPSRRKGQLRVIGHVGIVVSETRYIHAPGRNGTIVTLDSLPHEQQRLEDIHPNDLYTRSPVGIKRISLPISTGRWRAH